MKKFSLIAAAICVVLCLTVINAPAQQKTVKAEDATGLLYKISGKDLKKPSYLFGTIHIVCPNDMFSMEKISGYLDQTDQLIMELDMDNAQEIQAMSGGMIFSDGKTIKDYLTAEQYTKVDEMFKNHLGISVDNVKTFKPFMLQMLVSTNPKTLGCSPPASYEGSLVQAATARKKAVEGLETAASQFEVMNKTPLEKQAKQLYEMALNPQKSFDQFKNLQAAYKSQNSDSLYNYMNSQMSSDREFQTALLDERNKAWLPKIEKAIAEKPAFIAIGGGHLGGKSGVISLLRAKGYKIEAIKL